MYHREDIALSSPIHQDVPYGDWPIPGFLVQFLIAAFVTASLLALSARASGVGLHRGYRLRLIVFWIAPLCFVGCITPAIAYSFLKFYTLLVGGMDEVFLTKVGANRDTLNTIAFMLLGLYPIVWLHLRCRLEARLITLGASIRTCLSCGYSIDTLPLCPECGTPLGTNPKGQVRWRRWRRLVIAGYCAYPFLLLAPFLLSWIDIAIYHLLN